MVVIIGVLVVFLIEDVVDEFVGIVGRVVVVLDVVIVVDEDGFIYFGLFDEDVIIFFVILVFFLYLVFF